MRSLIPSDAFPDAARRSASLLQPYSQCHCYPRIIGGHGSFFPQPMNLTQLTQARPRVADFRRAFHLNMGSPRWSVKDRILFILRRNGNRMIANEDDLRESVSLLPGLNRRVHFEVFDMLPLVQQYQLVTSSVALAGVHGQALAWTAFLPTENERHCALLEILPHSLWQSTSSSKGDYYSWAVMSDVQLYRVIEADTPGCIRLNTTSFRNCGNVSIGKRSLNALGRVLQYVSKAHGSSERPAVGEVMWS